MRNYKNAFAVMCILVLGLFSCEKERLMPEANVADSPNLEASPGPAICGYGYSLGLQEINGNTQVDYCGTQACPPGSPVWGIVNIVNDYNGDFHVNTTLATSWFAQALDYKISCQGNDILSGTGQPLAGSTSLTYSPNLNKFWISEAIPGACTDCFYIGMRITVVKRDFFGGVDAASTQELYLNSPCSSNPLILKYCPDTCWPGNGNGPGGGNSGNGNGNSGNSGNGNGGSGNNNGSNGGSSGDC